MYKRQPSPSQEGVALLVARSCNEVVPAHKSFYARADPRTSDLYSLLDACMYRTRYQVYAAPGTRGSRLEYVQLVLVSYNTTAAAVRIL